MIPDDLACLLQPYTKSLPIRMTLMFDALKTIDAENVAGDVVECGVWRGGNIIMARMLCPTRRCWLYDTFDGMPQPGAADGIRAKEKYFSKTRAFSRKWDCISVEEVRSCLAETATLDDALLRFVPGLVEKTLCDPVNIPAQIAILRLDMDWQAPTRVALERLYDRLQPGGFLIVDDYGMYQGCRDAVDRYFAGRPFVPNYIDQHAIWYRR
jgi:O-methyltransferase